MKTVSQGSKESPNLSSMIYHSLKTLYSPTQGEKHSHQINDVHKHTHVYTHSVEQTSQQNSESGRNDL